MLELRPNCECCDKDLKPSSDQAMICTYECTFCKDCVENILHNVCPNCGGGFIPRPIRPAKEWRSKTSLTFDPPSTKRVHTKYSRDEIEAFCKPISEIPPSDR